MSIVWLDYILVGSRGEDFAFIYIILIVIVNVCVFVRSLRRVLSVFGFCGVGF